METAKPNTYLTKAQALLPGVILSAMVAMAAQFVAEHSSAPAMLMALLFGMAVNFMSEESSSTVEGVRFSASTVLKVGIVFLGARVSLDIILSFGWPVLLLVICGLLFTMTLGLILGSALNLGRNFSALSAGAVSICGASAALAISSVLPKNSKSEQELFVTIVGVTTLSTVAMILYPVVLGAFGTDETTQGVIIGATIHDVAQVVGAGYSVSDQTGETATIVKLIRVTLLAPTVLLIALAARRHALRDPGVKTPPILPPFVLGFLLLVTANSLGWLSADFGATSEIVSKACLLVSIAAVGIKTNVKNLASLNPRYMIMLALETLVLAGFAVVAIQFL